MAPHENFELLLAFTVQVLYESEVLLLASPHEGTSCLKLISESLVLINQSPSIITVIRGLSPYSLCKPHKGLLHLVSAVLRVPEELLIGLHVLAHVVKHIDLLLQGEHLGAEVLDFDLLLGKSADKVAVKHHKLLLGIGL